VRVIIPSKLWIGNATDARDLRRIHDVGISAIVDLAFEEPVPQFTRELIGLRIPIADDSSNATELLAIAIETTASLIRRSIPTLVACSAGMSRSPSIVAAALALVWERPPEDVLQEIIAENPHDVPPLLWSDVKKEYNRLIQ